MSEKSKFIEPWLSQAVHRDAPKGAIVGRLIFNMKNTLTLPKDCPDWRREKFVKANSAVCAYESATGPVWVVSPALKSEKKSALKADPWLENSSFAKVRDLAGSVLTLAEKAGVG